MFNHSHLQKFQVLIDKVKEFADAEDEIAVTSELFEPNVISTDELQPKQAEKPIKTSVDQSAVQAEHTSEVTAPRQETRQESTPIRKTVQAEDPMPISLPVSDEIETLKQQLISANNEKVELFEVMKADLEWHKNQIQQLNDALEKQRDQYESLLRTRDSELSKLEENLAEEQKWFDAEVVSLTNKLNEVSFTVQQREQKIQSLESEVQIWKERSDTAVQNEDQTRQMERKIADYEIERNSFRKLTSLALRRVWKAGRGFIYRLRKR